MMLFVFLQNNLAFYKVVDVLFPEPALPETRSFILSKEEARGN